MRFLASTALIGAAATSVAAQQHVLHPPTEQQHAIQNPIAAAKAAINSAAQPMHSLYDALKDLSAEARATWDEVSMMFPEAMSAANLLSQPKPHTRKPDSKWDYVVKGADVQSVWVENENGEQERMVDGRLEDYSLRAKKVDPAKLGVDTVKQYSGYLDDEANDKHLFYCRSCIVSSSGCR
jgi:cathepsin A (carboxypeptidase C)